MLKRLLFTITLILTITLTATKVMAADNYLNSVLLEKTDNSYNIVLRSDGITKVKKDIQSNDKMVLTLKGVLPASNITTLYKDTPDINNLVVENTGKNGLKIYIQANDISKANVIMDTPNSAPITVGDTFAPEKAAWSLISVVIALIAMKSAKSIQTSNIGNGINIKEREIKMHREFKHELVSRPSINYKIKNDSYLSNKIERRRSETLRNIEHLTKI